jgi:hypothetical protein
VAITAYRHPSKPSKIPQTIEEQIAEDALRLSSACPASVERAKQREQYVRDRLEIHASNVGWFTRLWRRIWHYGPEYNIRRIEAFWAQSYDRASRDEQIKKTLALINAPDPDPAPDDDESDDFEDEED